MSRCPTDGPVLKSILGLYRPAADCLLSLSLAVSTFFHFPSPPIRFSSFFSPTTAVTYLLNLALPLLSPVNLWCPDSPSPALPLFSLICGHIQPSLHLFFGLSRFQCTNHPVSAYVFLYHSLFSRSCSSSRSPGVCLSGS